MLSPVIKDKLARKYGSELRYSKDMDLLAEKISKECKCKISGSTLRRLWGFSKHTIESPRTNTLDVIANFLNEPSWDALINHLTGNKINKAEQITIVSSKGLKSSETYQVLFGNKCWIVLQYLSQNEFKVIEQHKTVLCNGDLVELDKIQLHLPLVIKTIQRGKIELDGVIIGNITGVSAIKILGSKNNKKPNTK